MFANKTPWIVLLLLWMLGSAWWHVCKIKYLCADDAPAAVLPPETTLPTTPPGADGFTIADGNRFRLDLPGNFSFAKSGANANLNTLTPAPGNALETMVAYLKANPGRTLKIIGYYDPLETNKTTFANLGLARAEGVKQHLIQQGIPAASLTTKGVERNLTFTARGDSLYGGLDFAFGGTLAAPDTLAATPPEPATVAAGITEEGLAANEKYKSVFEPINLYFPLGEANYIKTGETAKFFDEAVKYLATHKDKKLVLTGYTDNTGPDATNLRLSRDRANDVKAKLRKSGIPAGQIVADGKGEANPKASNQTREGRKANRRVTVVVQ